MVSPEEKLRIVNANESQPIIPHLSLDANYALGLQAGFAKELIKAGFYAGMPDECRERYQAFRLLTPKEIVSRACELAEETLGEFARRGWLHSVPWHHEMVEQLRDSGAQPGFIRKAG